MWRPSVRPSALATGTRTTNQEPRARLREILDHMPARIAEARRIISEIDSVKDILADQLEGPQSTEPEYRSPILIDLTLLLGGQWKLTKRFKTFLNPENDHLSLKLLPLDVTLSVSSYIKSLMLNTDVEIPHRITGGVGIGKSHAVFLALVRALAFLDESVAWVALDPLDCLTKNGKERLIEQFVVLLYRIDHDFLLNELVPFYENCDSYEPHEFCKLAFSKFQSICKRHKLTLIHVIDQENLLHSERRKPSTAALANSLLPGTYATISIFISSATSSEVMQSYSDQDLASVLHPVPRGLLKERNTTTSIFVMMRNDAFTLSEVDRETLNRWVAHFGGDQAFIEAVEEHARGCPLETVEILQYFSKKTLFDLSDPWSAFFSSDKFQRIVENHKLFMNNIFSQKQIRHQKVYGLLMRTLDYHITAEPENAASAGIWLWGKLRNTIGDTTEEVFNFLQEIIDARYMGIEENNTPYAYTTRGAMILKSLDSTVYMDGNIVTFMDPESLKLPPILDDLSDSFNAVKGYLLEQKIHGILRDFYSSRIELIKQHSNNTGDSHIALIQGLEICPLKRIFISKKNVEREICFLFSDPPAPGTWTFLIPSENFFPMLDGAMIFHPSRSDEPPVLFPIQMTYKVTSHTPSDKDFAEGIIKRKSLFIHPLMKAFNAETNGNGRVQFIWVGKDDDDISKAAAMDKFDKSSWFTSARNWSGMTEGPDYPPTLPSLANIGYSCGEALTAAYASAQRRIEGMEETSLVEGARRLNVSGDD